MAYVCEWVECTFTSDNFDVFYEHVRKHTTLLFAEHNMSKDMNEYVCECSWRQCFSDQYDNELELVRHVLFHGYHAKLKDLGLNVQKKAKLASCTLDPQARNLVPEFPEPFYCLWENCGVETSCPRYYYQHMDGHAGSTLKDDPNDIISCKWKDCTFTTKKRFKLKEHCRTHTHEKSFSCPNCGGLFSNKTKFTDHLKRQNTMESESYQCSHCLKYCASERFLRDHMRRHINNVKCSLCDMTCPTQSALQHHLNFRHSNEKPYSCEMCVNSFKSANDLRRHQQTHNPVFSYTCEEQDCNYATKTLQSLRRHYKVWHEGPIRGRYECHICGVRYTRGTSLTKHLKKQHTFRWPAGHNRFRYKEDNDGIYRLQTVRFESVELSQQLEASRTNQEMDEDSETEEDWETPEGSNHQELRNMTSQEYENQLRIARAPSSTPTEAVAQHTQQQSSILSAAPTQQNFLDVLNHLHEQCQQNVPNYSTLNTAGISSLVPMSSTAAAPSLNIAQTQCTTGHDDVDIQEAVSLLAMLKNSGMQYDV